VMVDDPVGAAAKLDTLTLREVTRQPGGRSAAQRRSIAVASSAMASAAALRSGQERDTLQSPADRQTESVEHAAVTERGPAGDGGRSAWTGALRNANECGTERGTPACNQRRALQCLASDSQNVAAALTRGSIGLPAHPVRTAVNGARPPTNQRK
jgi:hypothetical protein